MLRTLAKTVRRGRAASGDSLEAETDQERVYAALKKRHDQAAYVEGRKALIQMPAGPDGKLRKLKLPSSVADFYRPVRHAATYDRWWFACPVCGWPMRITPWQVARAKTGSAPCFHRPHAAQGAAYHFKIPRGGKPPPSLVPAASPPPLPLATRRSYSPTSGAASHNRSRWTVQMTVLISGRTALAGEYDLGLPPRNAAEYAGLFEHAELAAQPGAGHFPWLDDPAWFTRILAAFPG